MKKYSHYNRFLIIFFEKAESADILWLFQTETAPHQLPNKMKHFLANYEKNIYICVYHTDIPTIEAFQE